MQRTLLVVAWVLAGCEAVPARIDAGPFPFVSADAGPDTDGGVDGGVTPIVALLAPTSGQVAIDLGRCLTLRGVDSAGAQVPLDPTSTELTISVGPAGVLARGDDEDCPAGTLPIRGLAPGDGVVELSAVLSGTRSTVRGTWAVVPLQGALVGTRDLLLQVGAASTVDWAVQPQGLGAGALGRLVRERLSVAFSTPAGEVRLSRGTRSVAAIARGTAEVTVSYASLAPVKFTLRAVQGMPVRVSQIKESRAMRPHGARIDVGQCLELSVEAAFADGSTQYSATWPDAPLENLTPTTWAAQDGRWCGVASGEAALRSCFGGMCARFDVFVGPAPTVRVVLEGTAQYTDFAGIAQRLGIAARVTVGEGSAARDVTGSQAVEWLPIENEHARYVAISDEDGAYRLSNGHVAYQTIAATPGVVRAKLAVRYGGVAAQSAESVVISIVAP